jgi:hypothetical protein
VSNQPASVVHIDPNVQNGTVSVDLKFLHAQPREARTDLFAGGSIDVERIPLTTFVKWPLQTHNSAPLSVYKLSTDGNQATRVEVVLGRSSDDTYKSPKASSRVTALSSPICPTGTVTSTCNSSGLVLSAKAQLGHSERSAESLFDHRVGVNLSNGTGLSRFVFRLRPAILYTF